MTDHEGAGGADRPSGGLPSLTLPENLLRHYAGVLRRRARWIGLGLLVGLLAGFVATLFVHDKPVTEHYYKATNTVVVNGSASGGGGSGYSLQQAALLVQSQTLLDQVAKQLSLTPVEVNQKLSATVRGDVMALDVTAISSDADQATNLANTAAGYLNGAAAAAAQQQFASERDTLYAQLDELQRQRDDLQNRIATKPADQDILNAQLTSVINQYSQVYGQVQGLGTTTPSFSLSTLQPARPIEINARGYTYRRDQNINARGQIASAPILPQGFDETDLSRPAPVSKSSRVVLGAAAGLVLGLISAFLVEAWDDRIRRRDRVEALTGLPVLAEIPRISRDQGRSHAISLADDPSGQMAERYRAARTSVLFALEASGATQVGRAGQTPATSPSAPVLLITSPSPGEGKSTTTANLAAAFADNGKRTLVVDGDFRRPTVGRFLSPVPNLVDPDQPATTRIDNVWFLSAPRRVDGPAEAVYELRRSIARWRDEFDVIVLDTPPMLTTNDATDLLAAADAVLLVLRSGQTRTGPAERVAAVLNRFRVNVLGIVLNGCDRSDMEPYYGYAYGYTYGTPPSPGEPFEVPAPEVLERSRADRD